MWMFFTWKSCFSREKGKSMNDEMFALLVRGCTDQCKENTIFCDVWPIFHGDFKPKKMGVLKGD